MITVLSWLWRQEGFGIGYTPEHVNAWARMVSRNLTIPHRLLCITDDPKGIEIETYPLWEDLGLDPEHWGRDRPRCYRRLKAFSEEMRPILGDRFVSMDIDCLVLGSLDGILGRSEDFIINRGSFPSQNLYNGSMWMMNTGARDFVWSSFCGMDSVLRAARWLGSDQAWMRESLGPHEATWGPEDGVDAYIKIKRIYDWEPRDTKLVFFQGMDKPWDLMHLPWVREHYR